MEEVDGRMERMERLSIYSNRYNAFFAVSTVFFIIVAILTLTRTKE